MSDINHAIHILKEGGIVIFPTDTAFGIGCRIDNHKSVDRLFQLRKRPSTMAMPVLVASSAMALPYYAHPGDIVRHLQKTYWPGALTIIDTCNTDRIYSPIRGGGNTIGLRMPDHEIALAVIKGVGVPILGSSANFHGEPTPFRFEDLDPKLVSLVDFVLPGKCKHQVASTVVDCSVSPYNIIRKGAVKLISVSIDTTEIRVAKVSVEINGVRHEKISDSVLPLIEQLLSEHALQTSDITDIRVAIGPGSFTGLRVGLSVANTLGLLLSVPVNGKKSPAYPQYR